MVASTKNKPKPKTINLDPATLVLDPGIQPRAATDEKAIEDYTRRYARGQNLGTVVVFRDPDERIDRVADGFHRVRAAVAAGLKAIPCLVQMGGRSECLACAIAANLGHVGIRYTTADKRRAIELALADPELSGMSDREIADLCGVSPTSVGNARKASGVQNGHLNEPERRVGKDGKSYPVKPCEPKVEPAPTAPPAESQHTDRDPEAGPAVRAGDLDADPSRVEGKGDAYEGPPESDASLPAAPAEATPADASDPPSGPDAFKPRVVPDGEWLAGFRIRAELSDRCRAIFDRVAVAWRRITGHERFKEFADLVARHTPATGAKQYEWRVRSILGIKGPDHWLLCSACQGQGHGETLTDCQSCKGAGFVSPLY